MPLFLCKLKNFIKSDYLFLLFLLFLFILFVFLQQSEYLSYQKNSNYEDIATEQLSILSDVSQVEQKKALKEKFVSDNGASTQRDYSTKSDKVINEKPLENNIDTLSLLTDLKQIPTEHLKYYHSTKSKKISDLKNKINTIFQFYGFPKELGYYQFLKETHGICESSSEVGAIGCYQFIDKTAKEFNLINTKGDFRKNVLASADASARYLKWLLVLMFDQEADTNDWEQIKYALAAYNAGHKRVLINNKVVIPRIKETMNYVNEIELLSKGKAYWVRHGDTLARISKKTGVSKNQLLQGNVTVTSNRDLVANKVLLLPNKESGNTQLLINRGMSLYYISKKTGVSIDTLKNVNHLKGSLVRVGDILNIPTI